ncbi:MAG: CPBP family intramembrane glutamic endopeptidase [Polyangiaceae bacterium]
MSRTARDRDARDAYLFLALACAVTWLLDLPLALAWLRHETPPPYALPMSGLGAFGPTFVAFGISLYRRELRETFGRWRGPPLVVLLALLAPAALHLVATLVEVALGGKPAQWFYPPTQPERVAALIVFPLGEEMGWRGFAYAKLVRRHGPVMGNLLLGTVWGIWHLFMMVTPDKGMPTPSAVAYAVATLALWSVVFAWVFERGKRSLAVAIALHMGAHIDNVDRAPDTEVRLRILRLAVVAVAAFFAGRALLRAAKSGVDGAGRSDESVPSNKGGYGARAL